MKDGKDSGKWVLWMIVLIAGVVAWLTVAEFRLSEYSEKLTEYGEKLTEIGDGLTELELRHNQLEDGFADFMDEYYQVDEEQLYRPYLRITGGGA